MRLKNLKKGHIFTSLFLALMFVGQFANAQLSSGILEPVKWTFDQEKVNDTEYDLIFTAKIDNHWHLYSQDINEGEGPVPTLFVFEKNESIELVGQVNEPKPIEEYDKNFGVTLKYFSHEAKFTQRVKLLNQEASQIKGYVEFMSCDDSRCLPPAEADFQFSFNQSAVAQSGILEPVKWEITSKDLGDEKLEFTFTATIDKGFHMYTQEANDEGPQPTVFYFDDNANYKLDGKVIEPLTPHTEYDDVFKMNVDSYTDKAVFTQIVDLKSKKAFNLTGAIDYQVCNEGGCIFLTEEFELGIEDGQYIGTAIVADAKPAKESKEEDAGSLWAFFLIAFASGLVAILTPCVFPMIPMTVSFFMKDKEEKAKGRIQAIVYGLSIIIIYVFIGSVLAVFLGPDFANFLSTHWLPNMLFFIIFMIFAASFFGMFEITLPNSMVNKSDAKADKGGIVGAIFMALTLVLVSFSCTGPIVGMILVESAGGEVIKPIVGMLGFSLAFAMPFTLFAFFPSWLSNLPKSGGWLNSVKVVLGFIEVALGLKFLSVADQTYHWGLLDREVYLAIWIVIAILLGLYLLGKLKFSHDSDVKYISVPRLFLAIAAFTFAVYMVPGMWGAPLKALSGYMPPAHTHDFDMNQIIRKNMKSANFSNGQESKNELCVEPKYGDFLHLPHGLEGYFDLEQAKACAKAQGKPIFVDFTGHGCVNCREMESNVWSDPEVLKRLENDFVVVALYVDDKIELPESQWITSTYDGKVKNTIGKINADIQKAKYGRNSQPYYVVIDEEGNQMGTDHAYDLEVGNFVNFLNNGMDDFNKKYQK
ncbi:MAG: thioredoxin family protein [Bacteroidales bacterium]|nr:thioredoxin family protein [Bacteroidales bacterium]